MDWNLLSFVPLILLVIFFIVLLYGTVQMLKANKKFYALIFFALAATIAIAIYSIYGHKIFG